MRLLFTKIYIARFRILPIYLVLTLHTFICKGSENSELDSLRTVVGQSESYEEKFTALRKLFIVTRESDFKLAEIYIKKALHLVEQNGDDEKRAIAHHDIGKFYSNNYQYNQAMIHFNRAIELYIELEDREQEGSVYLSIGSCYGIQQEYAKQLSFMHKALDIFESIDSKRNQAAAYSNIGKVYIYKQEYIKAIKYYERAFPFFEELKDYRRLAACLNALASIYTYQENYSKAIWSFKKAFTAYEISENRVGMSLSLYNMSQPLMKEERYGEAKESLDQAIAIVKEINDEIGLAICHHNLGELYFELGNNKKSVDYFHMALDGAIGSKQKDLELATREKLAEVYADMGRYDIALENYTKYGEIKDSITTAQIEAINKVERKHISDKNKKELELIRKQNELKEYKSRNTIIIVLSVSIILFILLFGVYRKYRNKKKSNLILEERNTIIKEKNKEITDSISYARRIQNAILPSDEMVAKFLPESFILFKPKDIVAGDFYWLEQKGEKVLFAVADCTGHGVPGAMVSVFCSNALNRSVHEKGLTLPGKILDNSRETIISEFEKSDEEVKDGMDIALCSLNGMILEYAGAHNPLWIVRNCKKQPLQVNTTEVREFTIEEFEDVLYEVKGERQPVGKYRNSSPFTTHTIKLLKGDMIYLFSDGFVDQFGGEKSKKFMAKALKKLLLGINGAPLDERRTILEDSFENWKGELEQVDDVCIVGVQV